MQKHELKNIELYEEDNDYYLRLKYILEDDYKIQELEIPKVWIPFCKDGNPILNHSFNPRSIRGECKLVTGYECELELKPHKDPRKDCIFYTYTILKEKPQEMTLAEIEEKLGYKVKIVSEDGKNG